ncbi:TPA: MBL fold metallo-hydrolase [Pseudomonas aeruginosa]
MSLRSLTPKLFGIIAAISLSACAAVGTQTESARVAAQDTHPVRFEQIRNATVKVSYGDTTFLIDPMLAEKETYPTAPGAFNDHLRNPRVDLPTSIDKVIEADAVIVTHLHFDHWDEAAKQHIPKDMPIFAQNPEDAEKIREAGFRDVRVFGEATEFNGVRLTKTSGQHGSDAAMAVRGPQLGKVSGVVFQRPGFKTLYLAGDTVWNRHVETALTTYRPDVIVLNTGYVRFRNLDGAIIMGKEDLLRANRAAPTAYIIASHMDALSHATQSRKELAEFIVEKRLDPKRVLIPEDGQSYTF